MFNPDTPEPLELRRCNVAERGMAPLGIVVTDVFDDRLACLLARLEVRVVDALDLQGAVDRFHRRVVPAIPFATHRHRDASRLELASIVLRSVLRPTVRVMHQARIGIAPPQCAIAYFVAGWAKQAHLFGTPALVGGLFGGSFALSAKVALRG